jgi:Kef-type K+ transport system membrane component KefB
LREGLSSMLWGIVLFVVVFVASLASITLLILYLPTRYFVDEHPFWKDRTPLVRGLGIVGKNLLGLAIVALGIALSIPGIPGQGVLTILVGLVLIDIPGKRRLVRLLARRPWIQRSINGLRTRFRRPPMVFEPPVAKTTPSA